MSENEKSLETLERVGGYAAVDFVNTVSAWNVEPGERRDHLPGFADFLRWNEITGLLWPKAVKHFLGRPEAERSAALVEVHALRKALYEVFAARAHGEPLPQKALDCLNDIVRRTVAWRRIAASVESGCREICCVWDFDGAPAIASLGPLAWSAAEVLENAPLERVKECPGEHCGWIFVDTSRNRSRQWCSMKSCGNSAKVRRFRERQQG